MEIDRFCDMIPISKKAMRKTWFFTSYYISDDLDLPLQAIYMVWRREKRTPDDTTPMIVGLVQFERTVRENKLIKIPGIVSVGPTKSFEYGFKYFNTLSWKVASQVHVLGPIKDLNLTIPFYPNLKTAEQVAEDDLKGLLSLVDQGNTLMDIYLSEPIKASRWHTFLELAFKEKNPKTSKYTNTIRKKR